MTAPSITVLRSSHDRLRRLAEPLDGAALRGRAYPTEWSMAQVLSHIGSGAEINTLIFDAGVAGAEPPDRGAYQSIWDAWNAKAPEDQAADAIEADRNLVERFEALRDDGARFTIWSGPTDAEGFALARLSEHAVHTWDIAVALDPGATIAPDAVARLLDTLGQTAGLAGKPAGHTAHVHVRTTDPEREFALSIGDTVALSPWTDAEPASELSLPAEALIRLVYGRLDPDHTPAVSAQGVDLADLRAVFRGF